MPLFGSLPLVSSIAGQFHSGLSRACSYLALLADPATAEYRRCTSLAPGSRYVFELAGDAVFAIHECYIPKAFDDARLEYHHRNADIQFVLIGSEMICIGPGSIEGPREPFQVEKDIGFVPMPMAISTIQMAPLSAMLILPGEFHAPGIRCSPTSGPVHKCVVKIALSHLNH